MKQIHINGITQEIQLRHSSRAHAGPILVAISGIDGSGKGFIANKLANALKDSGFNVANIGIDPWQNLPQKRFSKLKPGSHFYHHAMRFEALFEQLIFPLKEQGYVHITTDILEQTASQFSSFTYHFENIDVILLEGIFLFQPRWLSFYDMTIWIECSFDLALQRAINRNQEGLSEKDLIAEYQSIYFPAQEYHQTMDEPYTLAEFIFKND